MTRLAVVIPALNEAGSLPQLLADLARVPLPLDIVVTDGGSSDGTPELARLSGATVIAAARGRARQMNAGAAATSAETLLFLHADVRVGARARAALASAVRTPQMGAAVFDLAIDAGAWWYRAVEWGARQRHRWLGLAYGDQGLLVRRSLFEQVGGFPEQPLMEDVEIIRRLKRLLPVHRLDAPLLVSARRWRRVGPLRLWLGNAARIVLYHLGVPARLLARGYGPEHGDGSSPGQNWLLIFVKAPVAGEVKSRLAADVGPERAAAIYRELGAGVVARVAGGPWRAVVVFAPAERADEVRAWLGDRLDYQAQREGDLGARLAGAIARAFGAGARRVVAAGSDIPELSAEVVRAAFDALDRTELVLGPCRDGGYYLIGMRSAHPALFDAVSWGTERVTSQTLEGARREGLSVQLLPALDDVDTAAGLAKLAGLRA